MIGAEQLSWLQDGAIFINTARRASHRRAALLAELQTGRISAALDVFEQEPLPDDSPFRESRATSSSPPHIAAVTEQAYKRASGGQITVDEVARFLRDGKLRYEVTLRYARHEWHRLGNGLNSWAHWMARRSSLPAPAAASARRSPSLARGGRQCQPGGAAKRELLEVGRGGGAATGGGQALVCPADVSDDAQIHAALEQTRAPSGRLMCWSITPATISPSAPSPIPQPSNGANCWKLI